MTKEKMSAGMRLAFEFSTEAERKGRHSFSGSPHLSKAGQFYIDCSSCGRSVFENGVGSALEAQCKP